MSSILESIGSLFSPLATNVGLKNMFERCLAARTKAEEKWLVQDCLRLVKMKLSESSTKTPIVTKCLLFGIFSEMLGYKADFAHIHAVKLAQQGTLIEKKVGYLACAVFLRPSDPLSVLLVNTILRDLASRNIVVVAMALTACCHLLLVDQLPILLPNVLEKLTHSNAYVRSKAVVVMHHFHRLCPEQCCHYTGKVQSLLGDKDPGVVALVIQFLLDVIQTAPSKVEEMVDALTKIQRQILEGKMPKDYIYRQIPAPWMQVSILKLLHLAGICSLDVQRVVEDTLIAARGYTSREEMQGAIVCECITTLAKLETGDSNLTSAMDHVSQFLSSNNTNLRYEGLNILEVILRHCAISLTPSQQNVIVTNLQHTDPAMKRKTLSLLCTVATESNARSVCTQLADYALVDCADNHYLRKEMVTRAISLVDKFPDSQNYWHIAMLIRLLPLAEDDQSDIIQSKFRLALLAGNDDTNRTAIRQKVLKILKKYSESKTASTAILEAYVWALGQFFEVNIEENSNLNPAIRTLTQICHLGLKVLHNLGTDPEPPHQVSNLLVAIVQASAHIAENSGVSIELLNELLHNITASSIRHALLRACCSELVQTLPHIQSVYEALHKCSQLRYSTADDENKFDFTLSFLDEFVCESLESGEEPYWSPTDTPFQPPLVNSPDSRSSHPSCLAESSPRTAPKQPSSTSSGTGSISELLTSSSLRSEDSKPWLLDSSNEPTPLLLWNPQGRVSTADETPTISSSGMNEDVLTDNQYLATHLFGEKSGSMPPSEQYNNSQDQDSTPQNQGDLFDELLDNNFRQLSVSTESENS